MQSECEPASIVICCGVPAGTSAADLTAWAQAATRSRLPVTWAARPADMAAVIEACGLQAIRLDLALALDAQQLQSRPTLRREIASARAIAGSIECVVAAGTPSLEHRSLLVEQGVHTIAVGGFDTATRSSRRPAPEGWSCRSVVWGLWEVQSLPEVPRSAFGRLVPWAIGPRAAAGSLTVVHIDPGPARVRTGLARLERLTAWVVRQGGRVRAWRLSDLPDLLRAASQRDTGSVLRQAA